MKVVHDWLKDYIGDSIPSAEKIEELLTFHAFEIEGVEKVGKPGKEMSVIDVDVLPNRSSDCLSHRGIAREIATLTNSPLVSDPLTEPVALKETDVIEVTIEDPTLCPRFTASLIKGIEVKESPEWLRKRLEALGQRPINNIVDATNYVMFALGQPIHAYDADLFPQVDGSWRFGVRVARPGEIVSLIAEGGKEEDRDVELKGTELLIIDNSSDTPIGLAGVKGGRFAGVHEGTKNIIVEAAHFNPTRTRQTARGLGIVIDASKRFENEPSRELPPYAQRDVIDLIIKIAGGTYEGWIDQYLEKKESKAVVVTEAQTNALLGLSLTKPEMMDILTRVGCAVEETSDGFKATGPWERTDLNIAEDFIEEIGRVHGYSHVTSLVPASVPLTEYNQRHYYSEIIRDSLVQQGFSEVITSSFRKKDDISLFNALASDKGCLRSSLMKNLEETLDKNAHLTDLLGVKKVQIFELGTVFKKADGKVVESVMLGLGVRTKVGGYTEADDTELASVIGELTNDLDQNLEFKKKDGVAELDLTALLTKLPEVGKYEPVSYAKEVTYEPFSTYPHVSRDIALWVEKQTLKADVEKVLNENAGTLRIRTTLFDEFHKDDKTSYAFRLVFQANDRTLTDEEVNAVMEDIYTAVKEHGFEVR